MKTFSASVTEEPASRASLPAWFSGLFAALRESTGRSTQAFRAINIPPATIAPPPPRDPVNDRGEEEPADEYPSWTYFIENRPAPHRAEVEKAREGDGWTTAEWGSLEALPPRSGPGLGA